MNKWFARYDLTRPTGVKTFSDLLPVLRHHFNMHVSLEQFLGPYNARQRASALPYSAPDRELLKMMVKQGGVNFLSYNGMLSATIEFCQKHKGQRALPLPHPSTIHSIQLPKGAFSLTAKQKHTEILIPGVETPLLFNSLKNVNDVKFVVVRPRVGRAGTPSADRWEILLFKEQISYMPDWADTEMNTRYAGSL
jgi:hypothetical protein